MATFDHFTVPVTQEMLLPMTEPFAREQQEFHNVRYRMLGNISAVILQVANECWADEWRESNKMVSAVEGALLKKREE